MYFLSLLYTYKSFHEVGNNYAMGKRTSLARVNGLVELCQKGPCQNVTKADFYICSLVLPRN